MNDRCYEGKKDIVRYYCVFWVGLAFALLSSVLFASADASARITRVTPDAYGESIGVVYFADSKYGLIVTPQLQNLDPGPLALHVHENPSCKPGSDGTPAGAAGDHYDPHRTGVHEGPYGSGHLGDLPNLIVENNGTSTIPVLAPRVKVADLKGRSIMIHIGPDRYDSHSMHHDGTGGSRIYCGVII